MTRKTNAVITTACVGVAAGAAAYMMSSARPQKVKQIKKSTGRALRQVGDFIGNVSYMMK